MNTVKPNIRIFVSSTFLDMQKERDILNQDVFPLLKGHLEKLGVNVTVVDLRWGITKEDQLKNNVIGLCLDEINHCKPYFIGLIGNRYGWCPDRYEDDLVTKYPFISENIGKSVTELEMVLGAFSAEDKSRCFFYFKDESLCDPDTSDHKEAALNELKRQVDQEGISHQDYSSFDEFKEAVLRDLLRAIEEDYPSDGENAFVRQDAYLALEEAKHVNRLFFAAQATDILTYGEENHVAVTAYSPEMLGKTSTFTHLIQSKKGADKIIINVKADENLQRFPAHGLYKLIVEGLKGIGIELTDFSDVPEPNGATTYESYCLARLGNLKKNLYQLKLERPLYILINDIDLLFERDISQAFVRQFLFDRTRLPDNLFVFMTSNNPRQKEMTQDLIIAEMHADSFGTKQFFVDYLSRFAKKIDQEILDEASPSLSFIDYKLIADYLIYYCNYSSYAETARCLLSKEGTKEILMRVLQDFLSKLSPKCASLFAEILLRLTIFEMGMSEDMIFDSYDEKTAIEEIKEHQVYVDISEIEKASIMRCLRYFTDSSSGVILVENGAIKTFLKENVKYLFDVVSASYQERSEKAVNALFDEVSFVSKYGKSYSKEEYLELLRSNEEKERNIGYAILDPLSAYLDYRLGNLTKLLSEESYTPFSISDKEMEILAFVRESAHIYQIDTRLDLYQKLLSNKALMFFVADKSRTLARRLVLGYINLYKTVMKNQYGRIRENDILFSLDYSMPYLHDECDGDMEHCRTILLLATAQILYEQDMYEGDIVQLMSDEGHLFQDLDDFTLTACGGAGLDFMLECEDTLSGEVKVDDIRRILSSCRDGYFDAVNLSDKIVYAYYGFKTVFILADNEMLTKEDYQKLLDILQTIEGVMRYCFYPEVLGFFETFFGRLDPQHLMQRIKAGVAILAYLGYDVSLEAARQTIDYFK